jgi:hypothetical protein
MVLIESRPSSDLSGNCDPSRQHIKRMLEIKVQRMRSMPRYLTSAALEDIKLYALKNAPKQPRSKV